MEFLILSIILEGAGEKGNGGGEGAQANDWDSHAAEVARAGGEHLRDGAEVGQSHLALFSHHHAWLRSKSIVHIAHVDSHAG